jgi:serine protease Do
MTRHIAILIGLLSFTAMFATAAEDRRQRVLNDRAEVQSIGNWIYNDLAKGIEEATRTRKPMLVVFRCIP